MSGSICPAPLETTKRPHIQLQDWALERKTLLCTCSLSPWPDPIVRNSRRLSTKGRPLHVIVQSDRGKDACSVWTTSQGPIWLICADRADKNTRRADESRRIWGLTNVCTGENFVWKHAPHHLLEYIWTRPRRTNKCEQQTTSPPSHYKNGPLKECYQTPVSNALICVWLPTWYIHITPTDYTPSDLPRTSQVITPMS